MSLKIATTLLTALLSAVSFLAQAATGDEAVGTAELNFLVTILTGNIGFAAGLLVAIIGVYRFAVHNEVKGGITMIILGVLITLLPGIFNGMRLLVCPIVRSLGAEFCNG